MQENCAPEAFNPWSLIMVGEAHNVVTTITPPKHFMALKKRQLDGTIIMPAPHVIAPSLGGPQARYLHMRAWPNHPVGSEPHARHFKSAFGTSAVSFSLQRRPAIHPQNTGVIPASKLQDPARGGIADRANVKTCYKFAHGQVCCLTCQISEKASHILRKLKCHVYHQENTDC